MKLNIYMKSGNIITVGGVKEYKVINKGDEIIHLTIEQRPYMKFFADKLLVNSINLSQIEAVTIRG